MANKTKPLHFLKEWREFRKLTQTALADLAGTTKAVISLLESGDRQLTDKWARRLAPHLRTTPGALLDYDPASVDTSILEIWSSVDDNDREQAARVLRTFRRKAG